MMNVRSIDIIIIIGHDHIIIIIIIIMIQNVYNNTNYGCIVSSIRKTSVINVMIIIMIFIHYNCYYDDYFYL